MIYLHTCRSWSVICMTGVRDVRPRKGGMVGTKYRLTGLGTFGHTRLPKHRSNSYFLENLPDTRCEYALGTHDPPDDHSLDNSYFNPTEDGNVRNVWSSY